MNIVFDNINIALFIVAGVYIFLMYLIFFKTKERAIRNSYTVAIFAIWLWTVSMILYRSASPENSLAWCKILYISATFTASSFFIFSYIFPEGILPKKKIFYLTILYNIVAIAFVIIPGSVIAGVKTIPGSEKIILWGPLYYFYTFYISSLFLIGLVTLFKKFKKEEGKRRSQIKLIFSGYFIGSNLAMFTNMAMLSWGDFRLNWLGQITSTIMAVFTVYAIIAHHLMDIKVALRRYFVYSVSIFFVVTMLLVFRYFISPFFPNLLSELDFILLFIAILIFPPAQGKAYYLANKYFFSSLYESGKVIAGISERLQSTLDLKMIYDHINGSFDNAIHIRSFAILSYYPKYSEFLIEYNRGFELGEKLAFVENDYMIETFIKNNKPIMISDFKDLYYNKRTQGTVDMLLAMKVELLCPLVVKNRIAGLMLFGPKESGDLYNEEDLQVIGIVASQSAIAIENAMLYEETKNFSTRMEQEVREATAYLTAANERLMKLDEAKSEFISIASHQLRTPLTVIKGYISMILEGNFGKISKVVKDSLGMVYEANQRLVNLVENLLNISRIESGNLKFNLEKVRMEAVVKRVVDEMRSTAKNKGITLVLKLPKKETPEIMIDTDKIRQVILNIVDNSIKYSDKGKIAISLSYKDKKISFCIVDAGAGLREEDIPNLFNKFNRGTGAMLEYTEGSGLGLYVAKQLIEAHHGSIWAESKGKGQGSKFCFVLPANA